MTHPVNDERSPQRRAQDERIAVEPLEAHLARHGRRPVAVAGVVENGLVRPLNPSVKLVEHSRVIIVASEGP